MVIADKLMSVGIMVLSGFVGIVFFYISSNLTKKTKMIHIEKIFSQLLNFVIFIWVGKVILNFSLFIKDPLAVLAYPSNSSAFYLAILFSGMVLVYKRIKHNVDLFPFIKSFLLIFLVASFLYEFIELIWHDNKYSFGYLTVLSILLVIYLLVGERLTGRFLMMTMLIGWSVGTGLLAFIQPFVTVFGYMMAPWFISLFFIINFALLVFGKRD